MKTKLILSLVVFFFGMQLHAQTTYIPDDNFEQALIDLGYDDVLDDYVLTSNISGRPSLSIQLKNISDLTGIEGFTNLRTLWCSGNQIGSLDLSQNLLLEDLACNQNQLTSLDVTQNAALTSLTCQRNQLTSLNVVNNTALTELWCQFNQITDLDISQNLLLNDLRCAGNLLTNLDVTQHTALNVLWCFSNQLTELDISQNLSLNELMCGDNLFTSLDVTQHTALNVLSCTSSQLTNLDVSQNLSLNDLNCSDNLLTNLDVSQNLSLDKLNCNGNLLTSLDVAQNTALVEFWCNSNQLTNLDVSQNINLEYLFCQNNQLTNLDLSHNLALKRLECCSNELTSLDLSQNTVLTSLWCRFNQLTALDVSQNTSLTELYCNSNQLTILDVRNGNNAILLTFNAVNNPLLTCINVDNEADANAGVPPYEDWRKDDPAFYSENCLHLEETYIPDDNFEQALIDLGYDDVLDNYVLTSNVSGLTSLNVSNENIAELTGIKDFNSLATLDCSNNQLTSIDVSRNTALTTLDCSNNQLTSIDVSQNTALTTFDCSNNQLISLDVRNGNNGILLSFSATGNPLLTCINVDNEADANAGVPPYDNWMKDASAFYSDDCLHLEETYIPDDNFEQALIDLGYDDVLDDYVLTSNISGRPSLSIQLKNISDLTGIEGFTNLRTLWCSGNQIGSLDLSQNLLLEDLACNQNQLTSLDVTQNAALTSLTCQRNQLTSLNVVNNTALTELWCQFNQITDLDISQNLLLNDLRCAGNLLTNLDVTQHTALNVLWCFSNQLTELDISQNLSLNELMCGDNLFTSLDVTQHTALNVLSCTSSQLTNLDVSQNLSLNDLNCSDNLLTNLDVSQNLSLDKLNCNGNLLASLDVAQNTALVEFWCNSNQLTNLDVSQNINLEYLFCQNNQLTNLDLSHNLALKILECCSNELTSLDLSQNTVLTSLWCRFNQLTALDVSQNTSLTELYCNSNQLTILDVRNGNNAILLTFNAVNNPLLTCINVDNEADANAGVPPYEDWRKDASATYSESCYNSPPIAICQNIIVSANEDCQAIIEASEIDNGSSDPDDDVISLSINPEGPYSIGVTNVTLTVDDGNGETSTCEATITVEDNTDPVLSIPANITVECDADNSPDATGQAVATDNCDANPAIASSDEVVPGDCPDNFIINRTWTATDAYGNTSNQVQTITVADTRGPVLDIPADITVECDADNSPDATGQAVASDNCDATPAITSSDEVVPGDCPNNFIINRTWTATDACGNSSSQIQAITVVDTKEPVISGIPMEPITQGNDPAACGAIIDYPGITASDNCSDEIILTMEPVSGSFFEVGTTTVTVTASDECGNVAIETFIVVVINEVPEITSVTASLDPIQVETDVNVSSTFVDNNLADAYWDWGDGTNTAGVIAGNTITGVHQYLVPGVYTLLLTVTDMCGEIDTETYQYVVIYDPDGGFVTGGGWINSPAGASVQYPDAVGKANFGFVSKYKKGATVPTGNTEFQFKAGDLNFNSYVYDWLVIAGAKAKFKGEGTINGSGEYGFMISAIDGDIEDTGEDMFRIKIWDKLNGDLLVYDNQMGAADDSDPTTTLGAGSIVIHKGKEKKSSIVIEEPGAAEVKIYPNPFENFIQVDLFSSRMDQIKIDMIDMNGRIIGYLYTGTIEENVNYHFEFKTTPDLIPGFYMIRIRNNDGEYLGREMILKQ